MLFWHDTDRMTEDFVRPDGCIELHVEREADVLRLMLDVTSEPRIVSFELLPLGAGEGDA